MVQVAIVSKAILDFEDDSYNSSRKIVVNSITEWDEVTEEDCKLLEQYFNGYNANRYGREFTLIKRLDYAVVKDELFTSVKRTLEKAKREEEARAVKEAERRAKAEATALKRKKTQLEKLKKELGVT